jgi:murein L,D-transpeptidase YcbB/YkuD
VVRALDIDKDGIHIPSLLASIMIHPSTNYVIHDRRIFRRGDRFKPRAYTGGNPHTSHIHDSIMHSSGSENNKTEFTILKYGTTTWHGKLLRLEMSSWEVKELQALLNAYGFALYLDSSFGPLTDSAVRQFQRAMGIGVDGIVGPVTRSKLTPGLS